MQDVNELEKPRTWGDPVSFTTSPPQNSPPPHLKLLVSIEAQTQKETFELSNSTTAERGRRGIQL